MNLVQFTHWLCRIKGHKLVEDGRCWVQKPNPTTRMIVPFTIVKLHCARCTIIAQTILEGFHGDGDKNIIEIIHQPGGGSAKLANPRTRNDSEIVEGSSIEDYLKASARVSKKGKGEGDGGSDKSV